MSLIGDISSSPSIVWLNTLLKERSQVCEGKPVPSLDHLRPITFGESLGTVPDIARWYFDWGVDLKLTQRSATPHSEGFQNIEASLLMRFGWYETYRNLPAEAVALHRKRAFWTFDICKGGHVVPVTMQQFRNTMDTFTMMPRR